MGREKELTLGVRIIQEDLDHIRVASTRERISTNTHTQRLSEPSKRGLVHSLVGEGSRTGDDTDLTGCVNVTGLDTHLASKGVDDSRAVGTDEAGTGLRFQGVHDL